VRTSNYIIYTFLPDKDVYYIVHGYTGAVDKVTPSVVRYLLEHKDHASTFHTKDEELVRASLRGRGSSAPHQSTIDMLANRGYLTGKTVEEELHYVRRLADLLHDMSRKKSKPSFLIIPSYECNLRCPYCFETETRIDLKRQNLLDLVMSTEMADDVFSCMDTVLGTGATEQTPLTDPLEGMNITLYGGEPLCEMTKSVVEYIVSKGTDRGVKFSAITNAVELNLFTDVLGPDKIGWVQITLDGPKELHDRSRIGPGYRETYDTILKNVELALACDVSVSIRLHVNWKSVGRVHELMEDIESRGLTKSEKFGVYVQATEGFHDGQADPVYPNMLQHEVHSEFEKHPPCSAENKSFSVSNHGIPQKLETYIKHGLAGIHGNMEYCSAYTGMQIYDPFRKIYSCWDTVGIPGKEIGHYSASGPVFNDWAQAWWSRSAGKIPECANCKYIFFHFGGCAALPVFSGRDVLGPACYDYETDFTTLAAKFFRSQEGAKPVEENTSDYAAPAPRLVQIALPRQATAVIAG
jgi:uncharacterized protein